MNLKQFISVSRPYSWPASLAPIAVAIALACLQGSPNWLVATLCLVVGLSAQSFSNCCNDYYDFKRGADGGERVGFSRPLASGCDSLSTDQPVATPPRCAHHTLRLDVHGRPFPASLPRTG